MTETELKSYRGLCKEIEDLDKRIRNEQDKPVDIVAGKVRASMTEFPYTEIHVGVEMEEPRSADARCRMIRLYREKREQAEQKKLEVERFIGGIDDPELRMIFRYRYIDGKPQMWIARKMNMTQSNVSKLISKRLKVE